MLVIENFIVKSKSEIQQLNNNFENVEQVTPSKTGIGYKLFDYYNGKIYPLFLGANEATPLRVWIKAENRQTDKTKGLFADRPGWHLGSSIPDAPWLKSYDGTDRGTYLSQKSIGGKRVPRVWAEVEYTMDIDYQEEANSRPTKDLPEKIPENGYYLFKEGSRGTWVIAGAIKVNRILSEEERQKILKQNNYDEIKAFLPYKEAMEKRRKTLQSKNNLKETFKTDHGMGDWLNNKRNYVIKQGLDDHGVPFMSSVTGYFTTNVIVPVKILATIKGENGEQLKPRQRSLDYLTKIMGETGKLPLEDGEEYVPFIRVAYDGSAWISEGNHRIMVANKLGWKTLPVEIRYFDGGDMIEDGILSPAKFNGDKYVG